MGKQNGMLWKYTGKILETSQVAAMPMVIILKELPARNEKQFWWICQILQLHHQYLQA